MFHGNVLSDETVQAAIDTNATLSVPTAVYFQTRANQENFALGDDVLADKLDDADDATLLKTLQDFEATCLTYLAK